MKKMTKTQIRKLLASEYMIALSGFASAIAEADDMYEALEKLDEKVWPIAMDEGYSDEWLAIYSGLQCGVE